SAHDPSKYTDWAYSRGCSSQKSIPSVTRSAAEGQSARVHSVAAVPSWRLSVHVAKASSSHGAWNSSSPTIPHHHWWAVSWLTATSKVWEKTSVGYSIPPKPVNRPSTTSSSG